MDQNQTYLDAATQERGKMQKSVIFSTEFLNFFLHMYAYGTSNLIHYIIKFHTPTSHTHTISHSPLTRISLLCPTESTPI